MRRLKRLLRIAALAVLAVAVIALLLLHTGPVQTRILQWSIGELERRFDLDLTADRLSFNLLTLRVVMTNVRLAAVGHHDDPFFTAESVEVRLPWAVYRGQLRYDEVVVNSGHVTISRDAAGVSNLPPGRGRRDPNAPPRRVDVRALLVRQLDFVYRDLQRDIEITTPRIRTDLTYEIGTGAAGPLAIDGEPAGAGAAAARRHQAGHRPDGLRRIERRVEGRPARHDRRPLHDGRARSPARSIGRRST